MSATIDFSGLTRGFQQIGQAMERAAATLARMLSGIQERANAEVRVSGLEAKYRVRGAFLVTHLPCSIEDLVQEVMGGRASDTVFLTQANRARVATAAMLGYVEHHPGEALPVAWHSTNVLVGRGSL